MSGLRTPEVCCWRKLMEALARCIKRGLICFVVMLCAALVYVFAA
jgi:hypothetical protein